MQHILYALLGLYFLGATLETKWGSRRMILFLVALDPLWVRGTDGRSMRFCRRRGSAGSGRCWFGSMGAVEAVAVAWALSNRSQTVRLFFVLPVTATGLLIFVIGFSVLYLSSGKSRTRDW